MPYPSPQTPSSFPQDEYNQPENDQYPEESPNPEPQESTRDLFYGTEELLTQVASYRTPGCEAPGVTCFHAQSCVVALRATHKICLVN
ncbi:hypothetical protein [Calothrix sp. NIES-3974]|uniref:hypothetical protein n=1 Tax=Calothrix sp. NIES-3974 TaxID=2005462 RepID=UPI000B60D4BF|nr:hypothetical protein [Calothrix sp. NIES-3974]BAZ05402.1 hypothetical protein NIES3974_20500 [Calothrix sp. NIES-3974]